MNKNQQIQIIENKITEVKNVLNSWIKDIEKYKSALAELINQLDIIKKQINNNKQKLCHSEIE